MSRLLHRLPKLCGSHNVQTVRQFCGVTDLVTCWATAHGKVVLLVGPSQHHIGQLDSCDPKPSVHTSRPCCHHVCHQHRMYSHWRALSGHAVPTYLQQVRTKTYDADDVSEETALNKLVS